MVHPSAELYGADRQFLQSVRCLEAQFSLRTVIAEGGPLVEELQEMGTPVDVQNSVVLRRSLLSARGAKRLFTAFPNALIGAMRVIARTRPDVILINTVTMPIWVFAAVVMRRRRVVHVHETIDESSRIVNFMLSIPLYFASYIVFNSEAARESTSRANRHILKRVPHKVVYNGIDTDAFYPRPRSVTSSTPVIVLVGRLSPRKGTDVAVRCVRELRSRGIDVELRLYGSVFPGYEWFEESIRDAASIEPALNVKFLGFHPDVSQVFADADIALVPSMYEPFGNVAVEAMLCQVPIIASSVGGLREIVVDGETGLLVRPNRVSDLVDAVQHLLENKEVAGRYAERGRSRALANFSVINYCRQLNDIITSVAVRNAHISSQSAADSWCEARPHRP